MNNACERVEGALYSQIRNLLSSQLLMSFGKRVGMSQVRNLMTSQLLRSFGKRVGMNDTPSNYSCRSRSPRCGPSFESSAWMPTTGTCRPASVYKYTGIVHCWLY